MAAVGMLLHSLPVSAATFSVTSNLDDGPGTLRQAIQSANTTAGTNTIEITATGVITLASALPPVQNAVTITGPGANLLTISRSSAPGTPDFRIFEFNAAVAFLSGVTISNGAADQGAGIWNKGQLTMSNCVIAGNVGRGNGRGAGVKNSGQLLVVGSVVTGNAGPANGFTGGGIDTGEGQLTVIDSTVSGNQAKSAGGGIYVGNGASLVATTPGVTLLRSTISGNTAGTDGGGINISPAAGFSVSITNCTVSGNAAQRDGGGFFFANGLTYVTCSTIANNSAVRRAGGLFSDSSASVMIRNCLIALNANTERPDVSVGSPRSLTTLGHNLIGQENSAAQLVDGVNGDIVGNPGAPVDPLIGPLQANLGPTFTHALLPGSRAIDAGDNTNTPPTDQQGRIRIDNAIIDIGAVESDVRIRPTLTCPANIIVSNTPGQCSAPVSFSATATGIPTPVVTVSIPSGSTFPVGTTVVTVTATNLAGTTNCSFTVTVVDAEAPTIGCPASLIVSENSVGVGYATVNYALPTVADNCGTNLLITGTPPPGSAFPIGTNTVRCSVRDAAGNSNSCTFTIEVRAYTTATVPANRTVCPGASVTFTTTPGGTGPFSFAWSKGGVPLPGETSPTLNLANVSTADAATYCVAVSGAVNSVTNCAVLTVLANVGFAAAPTFKAPPRTTASICALAIGTGPFTYQWSRAGVPIAGATNDCVMLPNVSLDDEGDYCVVVNGFCSTASICRTFAIQRDGVPPSIASASILCASNSAGLTRVVVAFSEDLVAAPPLNLANYSIAGLNITRVSATSNANTYLLETDAPFRCGFTYGLHVSSIQDISGEILTSAVTNLSTDSLPCCNNSYVLTLPAGTSLVANQLDRGYNTLTDVLPAVPEGSIVRVLKSGVTRTNAITEAGYPFDPAFDSFTFSGGVWSGNPVLSPGSGFFIYVPTPTNIVIRGAKAVVTLPLPFPNSLELVSRQAPVDGGFEDLFGRPPVEGIAVFTHVPPNNPTPVQPPNFERHLFRNGTWEGGAPFAGVGQAWFVQAIEPVVITTNPANHFGVTFGSSITFSVSATGSPELRYQWRHNGLNLLGETNSTLAITNVQLIDGGSYSVMVWNFFNTVESSAANLSLLVFDLPGMPLTNNYADRVVLTAASGLGNSSNVGANKEPGEPNHAGKVGGKSMWIDWQAPDTGIVVFATTGSSFDTLLAAYTNGTSGLVEVTSDEDSGGFLTSRIIFRAVAGQTYSIAVDGFGGEEGVIVLGWSLETTADKLALLLEPPQSVVAAVGDTVILTALASGQDLSYQWLFNGAAISGPERQSPDTKYRLRIKTARPEDAGLYVVRVYEGTRYIESQPISLQFNMEGLNKTVRHVLSRDKLLDVLTLPPPALAAEVLAAEEPGSATAAAAAAGAAVSVQRSYTGTQIFNTAGAVKQPGEPNHCGIPGGASQWYLYEPPDDGIAFINTDGSTFDTVLAVYTGPGDSFSTLVPVACDNNSGSNGLTSKVSFPAKFGTVYYVVVDGVNAATGIVMLNYTLLKPITLTNLTLTASGDFRVEAAVTPEVPFTIQRTTNMVSWNPILTNLSTNGVFQFIDTGVRGASKASYRLFQKP